MRVICIVCGTEYEARSAKARYCSDRCRKRKGKTDALASITPLSAPDAAPSSTGAVEAATEVALSDAERLDTPLGQMCLTLARRLDAPGLDTGSAMAAVAKQLESLLATATRGTGARTAPQLLQDELAERRRRHGA